MKSWFQVVCWCYSSDMTQLRLSLLGPFRAQIDDRPLAGFPTDKVRALLAFLALEPEATGRW